MGRGKELDSLRSLPPDVLSEVVREGELRLHAQFDAANAADQRAIAWFGFLVTLAIAALTGAATLIFSGNHLTVSYVILAFAAAIAVAAFKALECVRPTEFAFPGNLPENWLPEHWQAGKDRDLVQARVEQAICLNNCIDDNKIWAEQTGNKLRLSMDITIFAVAAAIVATVIAVIAETPG